MGAAGTRPSERPLVARSESDMTTQSTSSTPSFSQYNYAFTSSTARDDPSRTPQVSQYSLDTIIAAVGNLEQSKSGVFSDSSLRVEPETLQTFADNQTKTPTPVSSARMSSSVAINSPTSPSHSQSWPHPFDNSPKFTSQQPKPTPAPSITATSICSRPTSSSSSHSSNSKDAPPCDAEKRRAQLQLRVYRARTQIPGHIPLRVFREPAECAEAQEILDRNS